MLGEIGPHILLSLAGGLAAVLVLSQRLTHILDCLQETGCQDVRRSKEGPFCSKTIGGGVPTL